MFVKDFILNDKSVIKNSYLWNMISGLLMAFQSVIILMILTRSLDLSASGIFIFAYANANLLLIIGRYGVRPFQVSDIKRQFSFAEYLRARYITSGVMLIISFAVAYFASSSSMNRFERGMILLWMCLYKMADSLEDVYHAFYQQNGRLDIAGKALGIRLMLTIIVFGLSIIITGNLLVALIITTLITYVLLSILLKWTYKPFSYLKGTLKAENIAPLLKNTFPLFMGGFLLFFIGNVPRYSIDKVLSYEMQAIYGFIAMPIFIIGLLNSIIFNPMIQKISKYWIEKCYRKFVLKVLRQLVIIILITTVCIIVAYFVGIPVLSILYDTDLSDYRREFLVLLSGGGLLGIVGLFSVLITIIRCQKWLLWGYLIIAILAIILGIPIVQEYGILGAAMQYTISMGLLCICFIFFFIKGMLMNKES